MRIRIALVTLVLLLLVPSAAFASPADEQNAGRELAAQLQTGAKTCGDLSAEDFDHVGEYVMSHFLGSTSAHQAMDDRMRAMMGEQGEQRMHQLIGERFTGCYRASSSSGGTVMGPGMMSGNYGDDRWDSMMSSRDWSWMMGGAWRRMNRQDWQRLQREWLGASATTGGRHGWSVWAILGVALGAVLLAALAIVALVRRPFRRPPAAPSSS